MEITLVLCKPSCTNGSIQGGKRGTQLRLLISMWLKSLDKLGVSAWPGVLYQWQSQLDTQMCTQCKTRVQRSKWEMYTGGCMQLRWVLNFEFIHKAKNHE